MSSTGSSQMSRPYDNSISPVFGHRNTGFKAWHNDCFAECPFRMESKFLWDAVPWLVFQNLEWKGWADQLTSISPCRPTMVRKFYSSLIPTDEDSYAAYVRGKAIILTPELLVLLMNTRKKPSFRCPWSSRDIPSFFEVHGALTLLKTPLHPHLIFVKDLHTCPRFMDVIARLNICPSSHTESFRHHHRAIVMAMCNIDMLIWLPRIMFKFICATTASRTPDGLLPYGSLITRLFLANQVPAKCGEVVTKNRQVLNGTSFFFSKSLSKERAQEDAKASDAEESDKDGLPPHFFPISSFRGFLILPP